MARTNDSPLTPPLRRVQMLSVLAVALSATVLWLQLIPSWLAFASLGITLAAAGMASDARYGRSKSNRTRPAAGRLRNRRSTDGADRSPV